MRFSRTEIMHLLKSWVMISIVFIIVRYYDNPGALQFNIIASVFVVGIAFVLHELGHKFMAQKYKCIAEYRSDMKNMLIAVGMALVLRFAFIAPGAVYIHGYLSKENNGKVSLAGPAVNIALAVLAILAAYFVSGIYRDIAIYAGWINSFIAFFNLLPIGNFDGKKIKAWDSRVWGISIGVSAILAFLFML
ncbi:site-2 protease family protein [Candidatus Woesearchaeota archaeon]|nr:site-2 protease family protein [Candidatus Woesearchaeota archaeon]